MNYYENLMDELLATNLLNLNLKNKIDSPTYYCQNDDILYVSTQELLIN